MNTNNTGVGPGDGLNEAAGAECGASEGANSNNINGVNLANFFNLKTGEVNVRSLPPEDINGYLNNIALIVSKLRDLFYNSSNYGFKAPLEDIFDTKKDFCEFLDELLFFFNALKRKFILQHKGINATSLSIDPTESGFPHFTDLWNFKKDHESAAAQLAALPPVEEILKKAVDSIFAGEFPIREQLSYAKHNYFSFIKEKAGIISEFRMNRPELIGRKDGQNLYKLIFYGFDERYNIFHFYSMLLTQDDGSPDLLHHEGKHPFLDEIQSYYKQDLFRLAHHLDSFDRRVHPKVIMKYTIGPYYSPSTINEEAVDRLIAMEPRNPFIFKFQASGIVSIKTIKESSLFKSFYNNLFGYANSREIFSDKFVYNYMIVPFKLKQFLRDRDEAGKPAKIYGLLEGGEMIE